ncbi:ROK family protein [Paenibacillus solisilvae]|uniref:ROK family protein n=1 Tax=Paenibacillus solisilvae TaxID=2486751 RepID=A0ABW0VPU1_9BACL
MSAKTKQGTNQEDVQEMNRSLVIRLLRKRKVCSRAELAQASGLNQSTITHIINEFMSWGLVVETGMMDGKKGRRSIGVKLNSESYKIIGVRLARKSTAVGLYDLDGNEYSCRQSAVSAADGSSKGLNQLKKLIAEAMKGNASGQVIAIGLAAPSPLQHHEGKLELAASPPGWERANIQEELKTVFELPVYTEYDAKAGALAHWWLEEAHQDHGVIIYVEAGQELRAGIVMDGKVYPGSLGAAGEIGHMSIDYKGPACECGHTGCLELYSSTSALLKSLDKDHTALKSVWKDLRDQDELTVEAVRKAAWYLGFGLVNLVNLVNPDRIILGGELSSAGDLWINTIQEVVKEHVRPAISSELTIELTSFEQDDILLGSATIAIDRILGQPSSILSPVTPE